MILFFFSLKKFIPINCYRTVYEIPYQKLFALGKRVIFMDIDNTLIPYDENLPDGKLLSLLHEIKEIGFQIIFMSNNKEPRVKAFAQAAQSPYVFSAMKPLKKGYRKALKLASVPKEQVITIGDQLLTDVLGSNRSKLEVILVRAIKKHNEQWFTKFNRKTEIKIINKMKDKYPGTYHKIKEMNE